MLRDMLEFARNPYPWYLAPMGYVRELTGIADRARELAPSWRDHLEQSQSTIEESTEGCDSYCSVLVVGSGNLLDVPLDTLCRRFDKVLLLDILHSRATKKAVRRRSNVELVSTDVTGVARQIFQAARRRDARMLPKSAPPDLGAERFDLIVSVNLLSQLAVIPCNFLKGHCPAIPPVRLRDLTCNLIEAHLDWISARAARSCLITDVQRIETLTDGTIIETDIIEGASLPNPDKTWDWMIAPRGSVYADRAVVHRIHAYRDFQPITTAG